jgi:hypothetical protein
MAKKNKDQNEEKFQDDDLMKRPLIAKRDHVVKHNEHLFEIKKGDDVSAVPEFLLVALKTEQVI